VAQCRELPAQGMTPLGHLTEAGKNGEVSLVIYDATIISYVR
jgi:hypothetical protein